MTLFSGIRRWDLIVMYALLGALFTFEMVGVFSTKMITITEIIKAYVPMPLRIMVLAWLCWHFWWSDIVKQLTPKA